MTSSTWAVLRFKFADDTSATLPDSHYQRLFTGAGTGSFNMVDFFSDMSNGNLDLSASQVFGWFTLPINRADYGGVLAGPGQYDRPAIEKLCKQTAASNGVNLSAFNGTLIAFNGRVDLFGDVGGMTAACDSFSDPSGLGEEMGHGYGLDHSRRDGSTQDYRDPWDVMSNFTPYMARSQEWGNIGPELNACCMASQGWLDESRIWLPPNSPFNNAVLELRPLHRPDLPGHLALSLDRYLIEYRPAQRWDAGFPRSAVFVHRFEDNHSYVMAGTAGNCDLQPGDSFESGSEQFSYYPWGKAEVISINDNDLTASLNVSYRPNSIWRPPIFDGGGIIIGGVFHPIPSRGPENKIVSQLVNYINAADITDVGLQNQVRQTALEAIGRVVSTTSGQLDPIRSPAPRKNEEDSSSQSHT